MLEALFEPRSVAVVGASRDETKVGHLVLDNLIEGGFPGELYPVNPKVEEIHGLRCHASLSELPSVPDLVVVAVPAPIVPSVISECGRIGASVAVVITAGFKETGPEGAALERRVVEAAKAGGVRILGPNCLGVVSTHHSLNASFAPAALTRGDIAVMSQSGAMGTAILDWAAGEGFGISHLVSLGNKADIDEADLMRAWAEDDEAAVVVSYLESVRDGSAFIGAAIELVPRKPLIVLKAGGSDAGARAVSSHTGSLAGSERAYEAAFRRAGVLRAQTVEELFDFATGFSLQPLPRGGGLAIITNAGGPAIMATDACDRLGVPLASLSGETIDRLLDTLPRAAAVYNPVDVLGDAPASRYAEAAAVVSEDEGVGAVLCVITPQATTEPLKTANALADAHEGSDLPLYACVMGSAAVREAHSAFHERGVPTFPFPERAVATYSAMYGHAERLREPPAERPPASEPPPDAASAIVDATASDRHFLTADEVGRVARAYDIPLAPAELARDLGDARSCADGIGYPVVLKVSSPDIPHKTDVGGIRVGIEDETQLEHAFEDMLSTVRSRMPGADIWGVTVQKMVTGGRELVVGVDRDPTFGPLLMVGLGGVYVEVMRDVAFRLCPVTAEEAREMLAGLRSYGLLRGARGQAPADVASAVEVLLVVSRMAVELPEIVELDINPLMVMDAGDGSVAADVRIGIGG